MFAPCPAGILMSMNPFEHFILTRFNVPLKADLPAGEKAGPHRGLDAGWLTRRFDLFERVCLPSLQRQTQGAFQWLVFLDWATPVAFKERMAALTVRHEFLRPVFCSAFDEEIVLAEIRRREESGKIRITTRLDSDDALHPRMIELVQETAQLQLGGQDLAKGFFISFPIGCCEKKGDFYVRREPDNAFQSFVSASECSQTVMGAPKSLPRVLKNARPMWCQVIHDDNVTVALSGVYWPWGGSSEFAPGITNGFRREPLWQCAEIVRSAAKYFFKR